MGLIVYRIALAFVLEVSCLFYFVFSGGVRHTIPCTAVQERRNLRKKSRCYSIPLCHSDTKFNHHLYINIVSKRSLHIGTEWC